jgi:hypothetical protein
MLFEGVINGDIEMIEAFRMVGKIYPREISAHGIVGTRKERDRMTLEGLKPIDCGVGGMGRCEPKEAWI